MRMGRAFGLRPLFLIIADSTHFGLSTECCDCVSRAVRSDRRGSKKTGSRFQNHGDRPLGT